MTKLREAIGPRHQKRASKTIPGILAAGLGQVLYDGRIQDVPTSPGSSSSYKQYVTSVKQRTNFDEPAWNAKHFMNDDGSIDTEKLLRECRDYLETLAFREVID